jgi:hypothetical protein
MLLVTATCNAAPWSGRSLRDVLDELQRDGIHLVFSSQLVRDGMRITEEPRMDAAPAERLRLVLKPFGLTTQLLTGNLLAIVRDASTLSATRSEDTHNDSETARIVVEASRYRVDREPTTSTYALTPQRLELTPGIDEDAVRALQRLPGTATNGLTARAHVRGAYEDELTVSYDGVQLFDPFHLKDFLALFGMIDPELVESIDYYSGGFPVSVDGRGTAVIDMQPRRAQAPVGFLVGESLLNSRLLGSGTFSDDRGEWLLGARRSNLTNVLRLVDREVGEPEFDDALARVSYRMTDDTTLRAGGLYSTDRIGIFTTDRSQRANAEYTDGYAWFGATTFWTRGLASRTQFTMANLSADRSGELRQAGIVSGSLASERSGTLSTASSDWTWRGDLLSWEWGARAQYGHAHYRYTSQADYPAAMQALFGVPASRQHQFDFSPRGWNSGAYLSTDWQWGRWGVLAGVRWDDAQYVTDAARVSPRISVRAQLDDVSTLRFSLGRYVQTQELTGAREEDPTPRFDSPQSSRQLILAYERELAWRLHLRAELYDVLATHVFARLENTVDQLVLLPDIEPDRIMVRPERGHARGVEVTLGSGTHDPLEWWVTYAVSHTYDSTGGVSVPRSWDQRHAINAGVVWQTSRWTYAATAAWHSGWPYTALEDLAIVNRDAASGDRNGRELEPYLSLDLRTQYTQPMRLGALELALEVRNVTNHANECCRRLQLSSADPSTLLGTDRVDSFGILPIISVNWRFP